MRSLKDLDTGPLIRREDVVIRAEGTTFPSTVVEVDHRLGSLAEVRVARELPVTVLPRSQGVRAQPSGDGGTTRGRTEFPRDLPCDVGVREAAQRQATTSREFASKSKDGSPIRVRIMAGPSCAGSILQTVIGILNEATAPEPDGVDGEVEAAGNSGVAPSTGSEENDLGPFHRALRGGSTTSEAGQRPPLAR